GPSGIEEIPQADTGPRLVELAPLGHAVDVEGRSGGRHRLQLVEVEGERAIDEPVDRQAPVTRAVVRNVADVQHGKAVGEVLTRRQSGRVVALLDQLFAI